MANFTTTMKNLLTNFQKVLAATLSIVLFSAFSVAGKTTVVDIVVNSENHTTLEAAVIAAGLAETLSGDGPFTVFAPTDAAFAALPAGAVEALLADPSGALTDILKYHVVAGKVMSSDLSNSQVVTTLSGKLVTVSINANGVFINQSKVIVADIETDNGVVHVLDVVLVPLTPTSSVEISEGEQIFRIYPNPASSNLTIDLDENFDLDSKLTVSIVRLDGRIVVDIPANDSRLSYNVGNLSPGMYLVSVTKNGRKQTEKLIVK
ncbi:MAG: fasciclin domain-containing protein [Prolixibacteraceae bacterium]|nr:fasciclin domain-containing protein [Prolixibacteraceae bacterium]